MTTFKTVPLLILDVDGTIRKSVDDLGYFVNKPEDVVLYPEVVPRLVEWRAVGGRAVGISNQGGIEAGYFTLEECHATMMRTNELTGNLLDAIGFCEHLPFPFRTDCWCRKPLPGMVFEAVLKLSERHPGEVYPRDLALMVGDGFDDHECARRAGVRFQWAFDWRAGKEAT